MYLPITTIEGILDSTGPSTLALAHKSPLSLINNRYHPTSAEDPRFMFAQNL